MNGRRERTRARVICNERDTRQRVSNPDRLLPNVADLEIDTLDLIRDSDQIDQTRPRTGTPKNKAEVSSFRSPLLQTYCDNTGSAL